MHRLQAGEAAAVQHPQLRAELASPAICSQVLGSACLVTVSGLSTTHMMPAGCLLLLVSLNFCPGPSSFPHHLLNPPISVTSHLLGLLEPLSTPQGNMVGRGLCSSPHAAPPHSHQCTHLCGFLSPPRRHGDSHGAAPCSWLTATWHSHHAKPLVDRAWGTCSGKGADPEASPSL